MIASKRKVAESSSGRGKRVKMEQSEPLESKEFNFGILLPKFHDLERCISDYIPESVSELGVKLSAVKDAIPQVVVWGMQSSGKSSVLKSMFGHELVVKAGLGTVCPVELKISPMYDGVKYYLHSRMEGRRVELPSFTAALENVHQASNGQLTPDFTIIIEYNHPTETMIVTDLPGCIANPQSDYFNYLRKTYLCKPQTLVLHVARGDVDSSGDLSINYLMGVNNQITTVLTHTDMWVANPVSMQYLQIHSDRIHPYKSVKIAVVNDKNQDLGSQVQSSKPLIRGISSLRDFVGAELKAKTQESIPLLRSAIKEARNILNVQFEKIGRTKPNMRELVGEFRKVMTERVDKEFKESNTALAVATNSSRQVISVTSLQAYVNLIPSVPVLAKQMKDGSRRKLQGSEGWDDLVKLYSERIVESIKTELVSKFIKDHAKIVEQSASAIFVPVYRPATQQSQSSLQKELVEIVANEQQTLEIKIDEFLISIAKHQYNVSEAYTVDYSTEVHREVLMEALSLFYQSSNRATTIDEAMKNPKGYVDAVIRKVVTDPYITKAKFAHAQLVSFWKSKMIEIHNHIAEQVGVFEQLVEDELKTTIQTISHDDLNEPLEMSTTRTKLLDIATKCDEIVACLE